MLVRKTAVRLVDGLAFLLKVFLFCFLNLYVWGGRKKAWVNAGAPRVLKRVFESLELEF